MAKRKPLTVLNVVAYEGEKITDYEETIEEMRARVGEEEYFRRINAWQDRAMAAIGYYPVEAVASEHIAGA